MRTARIWIGGKHVHISSRNSRYTMLTICSSHLPVALSEALSGVVACTKPSVKKPESPLEVFCHEQQRHERIAFMMRGDDHVSKWPIGGHETSRQPPLEMKTQARCHNEDILMKDVGEAAAPNSKPSSSPFRVKLEVNGSDNVEDDPHLEEIRIAARIRQVALGRWYCCFD